MHSNCTLFFFVCIRLFLNLFLSIIVISGKAYALGSGELYGELGLGDRTEVDQPTLIDALKNESIIDVQSSCMHTLVLTEQGKVRKLGL
ncbi:unnamed protein product [Rhizopus stolonifer]